MLRTYAPVEYFPLVQRSHAGYEIQSNLEAAQGSNAYITQCEAVDYRFLKVNPAFEKNTGMKAGEIIGKTVYEVLPETEEHWINIYEKVLNSGKAARFELYSKALHKYYEVVVSLKPLGSNCQQKTVKILGNLYS